MILVDPELAGKPGSDFSHPPERTSTHSSGRYTGPSARPVLAHLPVSLDLTAVTRPCWAEYGMWAVGAVVYRRYVERVGPDAYVLLGSEFMNRHLPPKVRRPLLDDLLGTGVLESDRVYSFGAAAGGGPGKALCYRLGRGYRDDPIRPRPLTHPELLRKIAAARRAERDAVTDPVHLRLRAWHDRVELLPDAPAGEHPLLDAMIDGERRFAACEQGRIHHNIANLPREYRRFVRLAGEGLASVDVSASQPLLLALLLTGRATPPTPPKRGATPTPPSFGLYSDASATEFLRDCLAGRVYDRLVGETGYTRDEVKPLFLAVIYGHPEHMGTRVGEAVRRLYPSAFRAVADLNYALGHGGLPRLMQRDESRVMIGRAAGRMVREYPDVPVLTVHDSLLVPPRWSPLARRVVLEAWQTEFGITPNLKVIDWTGTQQPLRADQFGFGSGRAAG